MWSVGGSCDGQSRKKFDRYLRDKLAEDEVYINIATFIQQCFAILLDVHLTQAKRGKMNADLHVCKVIFVKCTHISPTTTST